MRLLRATPRRRCHYILRRYACGYDYYATLPCRHGGVYFTLLRAFRCLSAAVAYACLFYAAMPCDACHACRHAAAATFRYFFADAPFADATATLLDVTRYADTPWLYFDDVAVIAVMPLISYAMPDAVMTPCLFYLLLLPLMLLSLYLCRHTSIMPRRAVFI